MLGWENSPAGGATTPKRITCFRVFYDDDDEPCEFVEVAPIGTLSVTVADRVLNEMGVTGSALHKEASRRGGEVLRVRV